MTATKTYVRKPKKPLWLRPETHAKVKIKAAQLSKKLGRHITLEEYADLMVEGRLP